MGQAFEKGQQVPLDSGGYSTCARCKGNPMTISVFERAERYLSSCEGAISGSGGHNTTFRVAIALVHGFCLPAETAYQLLSDVFNPKCSPPWNDAELRHKIASA